MSRQATTPRVTPLGADDSIRIVSWNVSLGGGQIVTLLEQLGVSCATGERDRPTSAGRQRPANDGDRGAVVLLAQEAVRRSGALPPMEGDMAHQRRLGASVDETSPDIVAVADRCDLHLVYVPGSRNGGEGNGPPEDVGSAILSTLPLLDPFAVELPKEASRRVAVGATIRGNGGDGIRVVSVHFNTWPGPWRLLRTGNSSRVRQAVALIEALEVVARDSVDELPVVVGGDLNTWSVPEGALKQLLTYFAASPTWHGEPTRGAFPTDHLLLRSPIDGPNRSAAFRLVEYGRIEETFNSDHHPVAAWMTRGAADDR